MKKTVLSLACTAICMMAMTSCGVISRAGGVGTGTGVNIKSWSDNRYDLVPSGDRITYTIDISTPEGKQKLQNISLSEAQRLAETEATRVYNCDRLIDPRFALSEEGQAHPAHHR